jgi:hypothetical protein
MKFFLDTEFTDFLECELISIGIVSEDGREFYGECTDFDRSKCSDFVNLAVLPQLGQQPAVIGTEEELGVALKTWLAQFDAIEICFDYAMDFELFCYLCRNPDTLEMPAEIKTCNISNQINLRDIERYWQMYGRKQHHALHDAKANCFAFLNRS